MRYDAMGFQGDVLRDFFGSAAQIARHAWDSNQADLDGSLHRFGRRLISISDRVRGTMQRHGQHIQGNLP